MRTDPNFQDPDEFYDQWVSAHDGLTADESFELNARLVLLLANQIGDAKVLAECIEAARHEPPAPAEPVLEVGAEGGTPAA